MKDNEAINQLEQNGILITDKVNKDSLIKIQKISKKYKYLMNLLNTKKIVIT